MSAYESCHWARAIATRFRSSATEPAPVARSSWRSLASEPSRSVNDSTVGAATRRRKRAGSGRSELIATVSIGLLRERLRNIESFENLSMRTVETLSDSIAAPMRVQVRAATDIPRDADVLAVPVGARGLPANMPAASLAARVAEDEDIAAEVGRTAVLYSEGPARIVLVGLGPTEELDADTLRTAAAAVAGVTDSVGGTLAWLLDDSLPHSEQARALVDGLLLGTYDPGRWKKDAKPEPPFDLLILVGGDESLVETAERAATVATAANRARDLANTGANELTPERLAERA